MKHSESEVNFTSRNELQIIMINASVRDPEKLSNALNEQYP